MATMNISLPDSMKAFVEKQASKEGFGTISEYLRAVIRELQKRDAKQRLEAKLLAGLRSPAKGMTDRDWEALERTVKERSPQVSDE